MIGIAAQVPLVTEGLSWLPVVTLVLAAVAALLGVVNLLRRTPPPDTAGLEKRLMEELRASRRESGEMLSVSLRDTAERQMHTQQQIAGLQDRRLKELSDHLGQRQATLQKTVNDQIDALDKRFRNVSLQNEQKLENIRTTVESRLTAIQTGNERKLDEMRVTVDEKLHRTLDERLKQNFSLVNERLAQVYEGLGKMNALAEGVGDLKKVLSNVKTRGILGEIQLGAILEEILTPDQYATNVETVKDSGQRVEYAVKLPGNGEGESIWLPIDAKFPSDLYAALQDAYDTADKDQVEAAAKALDQRLRNDAKDIHTKYISVPETTEFGIMFLPVEGLYAEVVRRGLVERLQREYKINIAGPTTLAALLNSLQMGFRTLAIQQRSSEVWRLLNEVKSEFGTFERALTKAQERIKTAGDELETLVGTRTRVMNRKLRNVTDSLPAGEETDTVLPLLPEESPE